MINKNRRRMLGLGLAAPVALTGCGAYATLVEPHDVRVTRYDIGTPRWNGQEPLRIAALADFHVAPPFMTEEHVVAIVERTNALNADVVVLLGDYHRGHDFVTSAADPFSIGRVLAKLEAPSGVWAVLGNHDWDPGAIVRDEEGVRSVWSQALETSGIPVLDNASQEVTRGATSFRIAGLGSQYAYPGRDDLDQALSGIPAGENILLLAHEPDIFPRVPDRVALTMSGHTHGGQVRILGKPLTVPSRYGARYAYGHIEEGDRHLVVSAGLGCSRAPVRIGVPPEIVLTTLRSAT